MTSTTTETQAVSVTTPGPPVTGTKKLDAAVAYIDPRTNGGSMFDDAGGVGEPINVIISGLSDPKVLTDAGFLNYVQSLCFSFEFLGLHLGTPQTANLGDGNGIVPQLVEYRMDYGDPLLGTGIESLVGGNHLRMWRQNGPAANTGALFLAVSGEEDVSKHHTIIPNGYDLGRDMLAFTATKGPTAINGITYSTTQELIPGLLTPDASLPINHGIAIDGNVILLTVKIVPATICQSIITWFKSTWQGFKLRFKK